MNNQPKRVFGGRQDGAGRPVLPDDQKKRRVAIYLEPAVADWIEQNGGSKYAAEILNKAHFEAHIV